MTNRIFFFFTRWRERSVQFPPRTTWGRFQFSISFHWIFPFLFFGYWGAAWKRNGSTSDSQLALKFISFIRSFFLLKVGPPGVWSIVKPIFILKSFFFFFFKINSKPVMRCIRTNFPLGSAAEKPSVSFFLFKFTINGLEKVAGLGRIPGSGGGFVTNAVRDLIELDSWMKMGPHSDRLVILNQTTWPLSIEWPFL